MDDKAKEQKVLPVSSENAEKKSRAYNNQPTYSKSTPITVKIPAVYHTTNK
jgi:hypothetical protein